MTENTNEPTTETPEPVEQAPAEQPMTDEQRAAAMQDAQAQLQQARESE